MKSKFHKINTKMMFLVFKDALLQRMLIARHMPSMIYIEDLISCQKAKWFRNYILLDQGQIKHKKERVKTSKVFICAIFKWNNLLYVPAKLEDTESDMWNSAVDMEKQAKKNGRRNNLEGKFNRNANIVISVAATK